jgi:hypothetical protein
MCAVARAAMRLSMFNLSQQGEDLFLMKTPPFLATAHEKGINKYNE